MSTLLEAIQKIQNTSYGVSLPSITLDKKHIGEEGCKALAEAVSNKNLGIYFLSLDDNDIGDEGARYLAMLIKSFSRIDTLSLQDNNIGPEGMKYLAEALKEKSSLLKLLLNKNKIGDVGMKYLANLLESGFKITTLELDLISLEDEGIKLLAESLEKNTALKHIDLSHNKVTDEGARYIAHMLEQNKTLQKIRICSRSIGPQGVNHLAAALEKNTTLQEFELSASDIGDQGVVTLANALEKNTTITNLNLSFNKFGDLGAEHLARALEKNKKLAKLSFYNNDIGPIGTKHLAEMLEKNQTLEYVDMTGNKITDDGGECLLQALKKNSTITSFVLDKNNDIRGELLVQIKDAVNKQGNKVFLSKLINPNPSIYLSKLNMGPKEAEILANMLKSDSTIKSLDLRDNEIRDEGMIHIVKALENNKTVETLIVTRNQIGPEGVKYLAQTLEINNVITSIDLFGNNLSEEGMKYFAQMLVKDRKLKSVDLSSTNPGISGARYIAQALESHSTIQVLHFSWNRIGDEGAKLFAEMLEKNSTIKQIKLESNKIGNIGLAYLVSMLKKNKTLTTINLENNNIDDDGAQALIQFLENTGNIVHIHLRENKMRKELENRIYELTQGNNSKAIEALLGKVTKLEETIQSAEKAAAGLDKKNQRAARLLELLRKAKEDQSMLVSTVKESIANTKNSDNSKIIAMTEEVDHKQELIQKLQEEIIQCKARLDRQSIGFKEMKETLENAGVYARSEVTKGFKELENKDPELYVYCKTFYWTALNLFGAYRHLSTGLLEGNIEDQTSTKEKLFVMGAQKAVKYGAQIANGIPFVGGILGSLDSIIDTIYDKVKQNRLENKVNAINKVIQNKFDQEEDISISIGKLAIAITKVREQFILYPETATTSTSISTSKGDCKIASGVAWLREKVETIKNAVLPSVELHDKESVAATLALEDVSLFMAYLCVNFEAVVKRKAPLDQQCVDIIKYGGFEKLLVDVGSSRMSSSPTTVQTPTQPQPQISIYTFDSIHTGGGGAVSAEEMGCVDKFRQSGCAEYAKMEKADFEKDIKGL